MKLSDLPALGQPLAAGMYCGVVTAKDGTHNAVVLLPDAPSERLRWQAAMDWAKALEADLPSRPVAALLFANAKASFDPNWYWTNETEESDGSYAWYQTFDNGGQDLTHKSDEGRARAVRLIPLDA